MALEGTLRDFSLSDIFQLIGLQRKTGVLTLRSSEDVVTVSFLDGKVVGADSLNKRLEDRLGQVLLKTGAVSQADLDAALKTQMETLERLGRILISHDVISRTELKRAFEQQILQIIYRVFRWQDGDYHFSQETNVDYDAELVAPMGAESILMEGARMLDEWPIIEKGIPRRDIVFVTTAAARQAEVRSDHESETAEVFNLDLDSVASAPPASGRVRITPVEHDVLALVDGLTSVDEIVRTSPHGEFDTCKALYTLLTRALIRPATREEIAGAAQAATTGATPAQAWRPHFPWLALLLVPLFVLTAVLARHNPVDPMLGSAPKLPPRVKVAVSWSRMAGVWRVLQSRATLTGSYPETLAELTREHFLPTASLFDPWGWSYRYVLREHSVLLAGNNATGTPDADLLFSLRLGGGTEEPSTGPGAKLITP